MDKAELHRLLDACQQAHVLDSCDALPPAEQEALMLQLRSLVQSVDLAHLNHVYRASMAALEPSRSTSAAVTPPDPSDYFFVTHDSLQDASHAAHVAALRRDGLLQVAAGRVAVLVLAGGSGSRLGKTFPKGMLVCPELLEPKSLFQLHCEKIVRLQEVAECGLRGTRVSLLIMTSPQTDTETQSFFRDHNFFGLHPGQVHFFQQSTIPCYDMEGRILMESPFKVATAPGGNGGIYEALKRSGTLDLIRSAGVEYVQVVTVDNILVKLGDPVMVGYALEQSADVTVKATQKVSDSEAVGVFAKRGGKWGVVEYTEVGPDRARLRNEKGERVFDCANIAIHLLHVSFLERAASAMATYEWYHAAVKTIPVSTGSVKAVKLEAFIFDLFEFSRCFRILQVDRRDEFSPIKNSDDLGDTKPDTPHTAVRDLHAQHHRWIRETRSPDASEAAALIESRRVVLEISPLVSLEGENLHAHVSEILRCLRDNAQMEPPTRGLIVSPGSVTAI